MKIRATGMPIIDAREDFARARRGARTARAARWVARRGRTGTAPRTPCCGAPVPWGPQRLRVIALADIVGTVEPTRAFDARFRPVSELARARWERIALAHRRGVALPPITVLERADGYYVMDGRHRVSVARSLGQEDIEAWVAAVREGLPPAA